MHITKIHIENFRLLKNIEINIDKKTTLLVGRNNTAKTSILQLISNVLKNNPLSYNDYPLYERNRALKALISFSKGNISFDDLKNNVLNPSISFFIDYTEEGDADNLGALSPFIIDVNYESTTTIIKAEYEFSADEETVKKFLNDYLVYDNGRILIENLRNAIVEVFPKVFKLNIKAIDPLDSSNSQQKKLEEFIKLFPLYIISAERFLDEGEQQKNSSLSKIINDYFNKTFESIEPEFNDKIEELKNFVSSENIKIQSTTTKILSQLIDKSIGFGYPNADELSLGVQTRLDLNNQIESKADLIYNNKKYNDNLPSSYNGLGYKNLIKIQFELASFASMLKEEGNACIPILCIEEPESHMHPQMQQVFIRHIENFLQSISDIRIQTIITSHSSHIANAIDFSKIRYMHRVKYSVICKDLGKFAIENRANLSFIQKYLTLTKCDLFFADKAIFVEGTSEKLLIPDIIDKEEMLSELRNQYYTIIEVGGAYANKFIPLLRFLEIPCVIFTDIDSIDSDRKRSLVSVGVASSNSTINEWVKNKKGILAVSLTIIKSLTDQEKTSNNIHIEFQTDENGLCGRSLEEAIINVNRVKYKLPTNVTEGDIEFKQKSKTDFILDLITGNDGYIAPKYILNGLKWLKEAKSLR